MAATVYRSKRSRLTPGLASRVFSVQLIRVTFRRASAFRLIRSWPAAAEPLELASRRLSFDEIWSTRFLVGFVGGSIEPTRIGARNRSEGEALVPEALHAQTTPWLSQNGPRELEALLRAMIQHTET